MSDITYKKSGLFTRFYPDTKDGEYVWREMAKELGGSVCVLNQHAATVIAQIRMAGYSITKHKESKINISDDELLKQLSQ